MARFGKLAFAVALLTIAAQTAGAGTATLRWTPPTETTGGSPLTDLTSYDVYSGCVQSGQYERPIEGLLAPASTYVVSGLPENATCWFRMTTINSAGQASDFSNEASTFIPSTAVLSGPVENLNVTWQESAGEPEVAGITLRSSSGNSEESSATLTITTPTGTASGDLMVVVLCSDDATNFTASGWTAIDSLSHSATALACDSFFLELTASPAASYDFVASQFALMGTIFTFQHTSGTWDSPVAVSSTHSVVEANTNQAVSTGSVTAALNDALVCAWGNDAGQSVSTAPSGMTAATRQATGSASLDSYYQESMAAGAVTKSLDYSGGPEQIIAMAIVVSDTAAGGGPSTPQGLHGIMSGINVQRSTRLNGEIEE